MQSWLEWRNWVGKCAQATRMTASLRILSSKADSNTWRASQGVNWSWSQCIKSHHAQTSSGKGLPTHFWNRNNVRSILPGLRRKTTALLLSGPKSSFQMKVNVAFNLEIKDTESGERVESHRIHVAWSPVWSFHSQWWFGLPCHLLVLVYCVFWSPQSTQQSTRTFRALHASFCWQALWRCWFHFPAGLGTCPHCQRYQKPVQWPWCYCAWLATMRIYGVLPRGRWETPDLTMQMTWRLLSKQPGLPLHLSSVTGWLSPCHAALMQ